MKRVILLGLLVLSFVLFGCVSTQSQPTGPRISFECQNLKTELSGVHYALTGVGLFRNSGDQAGSSCGRVRVFAPDNSVAAEKTYCPGTISPGEVKTVEIDLGLGILEQYKSVSCELSS